MIDERLKELIWDSFSVLANLFGVEADKVAHFVCCFIASFAVSYVFGYSTGIVGAIMLGIGKEYGDKCSPDNYWSWGDIFADVLGALAGGVMAIAVFNGGGLV